MIIKATIRGSGLILATGALAFGASGVLPSLLPANTIPTPFGNTLLLTGSILIILALPGMYARQAEAAGWLGLVGHVLLEVGMVPSVVYAAVPLFYPGINAPLDGSASTVADLLGTGWLLGMALTGVAILRARVYSRGTGILLLLAAVGFFFMFPLGDELPPIVAQLGIPIITLSFASALAWIGFSLWTSPREHDVAVGLEVSKPADIG